MTAREDAIQCAADSPQRFEIFEEARTQGALPVVPRGVPSVVGSLLGIRRSYRSVGDNPTRPLTRAPRRLWDALEQKALKLGASSVGYVRVPRSVIFRDKKILYGNAVVLTMEMDRSLVALAPHSRTSVMMMGTYSRLGRITNRLADSLRSRGYGALAGHPMMGLALYQPLARLAGLGWQGAHGLMITPEHGPRVRLAAVFTSIENLPKRETQDHSWIADFCASCRLCIQGCPAGAIREEPTVHPSGQLTHIDARRCFPYFSKNYGCSVCIKICPLSNVNPGEVAGASVDSHLFRSVSSASIHSEGW